MKKIILSALLCVCFVQTVAALENPSILKSGTVEIPLVNFYPDTEQLFYTESIRPLEPYRLLKLWDQNQKLRDIRQTIYNIAHGKTPPKELFEYTKSLAFLCNTALFNTLTTDGKNVYLSVLVDYAYRLKGKIAPESQRASIRDIIPQSVRFDLWRILAHEVTFVAAFNQEHDINTINRALDNSLFSVLCYDREEAQLLNPQGLSGTLKLYFDKTLLTRPTDLEMLAQILYMLSPEGPTWTPAQAEAAIGLRELSEGQELIKTAKETAKKPGSSLIPSEWSLLPSYLKEYLNVPEKEVKKKTKFPKSRETLESEQALRGLEEQVKNITNIPKNISGESPITHTEKIGGEQSKEQLTPKIVPKESSEIKIEQLEGVDIPKKQKREVSIGEEKTSDTAAEIEQKKFVTTTPPPTEPETGGFFSWVPNYFTGEKEPGTEPEEILEIPREEKKEVTIGPEIEPSQTPEEIAEAERLAQKEIELQTESAEEVTEPEF